MAQTQNRRTPAVPDGWRVETVKFHYTLGYWVLYLLGLFITPEGDSPDVTYTVRHIADQSLRTIRLPGHHSETALAEAIRLIQAAA